MSRSGQSSNVMGAVSSDPPNKTCRTAGLRPGKLGPLCRKECPIILPAMVNRRLSIRSAETDGIRWSDSPSKILVMVESASGNSKRHWQFLLRHFLITVDVSVWPEFMWKPLISLNITVDIMWRLTPSPVAGSPVNTHTNSGQLFPRRMFHENWVASQCRNFFFFWTELCKAFFRHEHYPENYTVPSSLQ